MFISTVSSKQRFSLFQSADLSYFHYGMRNMSDQGYDEICTVTHRQDSLKLS